MKSNLQLNLTGIQKATLHRLGIKVMIAIHALFFRQLQLQNQHGTVLKVNQLVKSLVNKQSSIACMKENQQ